MFSLKFFVWGMRGSFGNNKLVNLLTSSFSQDLLKVLVTFGFKLIQARIQPPRKVSVHYWCLFWDSFIYGQIPQIFAARFALFLPFFHWPNMEYFRGSLRSPGRDNLWRVGVMRPSRKIFLDPCLSWSKFLVYYFILIQKISDSQPPILSLYLLISK